eukprot:CAMPEP_0175733472 /NCGR_PEP_ID=MMETSP0097-20121207/51892_1 /TAXON_ID=311494 /ORGANISM="Alexandrium monilatum, Strain CCMP3105" /LENGTH=78 /DNA_ID=CAMNT_0017041477 /DNA_START=14 /DNA_END=247 /DNA_ORIENTATION=+
MPRHCAASAPTALCRGRTPTLAPHVAAPSRTPCWHALPRGAMYVHKRTGTPHRKVATSAETATHPRAALRAHRTASGR